MERKLVNLALPTEAPDFTLAGVDGEEVSLSDYHNRHHVVLVFNRGFT